MRTIFSAIAVFLITMQGASASQIWLTMDQVRPYKLEHPAQKIVIGNPAIADVTVENSQQLLMFGKAPGLTNIYIFNEDGQTTENLIVRVRSPSTDMLTVHRGVARTTYNCTTNCETTITVGDDPTAFKGVSDQVLNKFSQAAGAASAAGDQEEE